MVNKTLKKNFSVATWSQISSYVWQLNRPFWSIWYYSKCKITVFKNFLNLTNISAISCMLMVVKCSFFYFSTFLNLWKKIKKTCLKKGLKRLFKKIFKNLFFLFFYFFLNLYKFFLKTCSFFIFLLFFNLYRFFYFSNFFKTSTGF